ncbi:hypothetical protein TWF730_007459 [Orbilia blumenaviensis]|uniref:Uncharacterized protein n=1 Tax=Orbilia blumenaviensis TaxID=1796055 RepID=A0AAV9V8F9_9PEZI
MGTNAVGSGPVNIQDDTDDTALKAGIDGTVTSQTIDSLGPAPQSLLYFKGLAGFEKSVIMALTIRRLRLRLRGKVPVSESSSPIFNPKDQSWLESQRASVNKKDNKPLVLFWFFKKGLDATQRRDQATFSLLAQMFDERNIKTVEEAERFVRAIQHLEKIGLDKKDYSNNNEGD